MATIQGIYVALFGRPADPTGLAYFNSVTQNGANLNGIGDLAGTQEYKDRFAGQTNAAIVGAIYKSLFNREPEAAGLNFFVDALNKGTLNIKNIAIAILDGAQGTDKTIVDLKINAANAYTAQLDTPLEVSAYSGTAAANAGRTFLTGVTTTAPTTAEVTTAVALLSNGNTITLGATDAAVSLTGATGFITTANNDTINANTAGDLSNADNIDGGLGVDTLNALNTVNAA